MDYILAAQLIDDQLSGLTRPDRVRELATSLRSTWDQAFIAGQAAAAARDIPAEVQRVLYEEAMRHPRLKAFAAELRVRNWQPPAGFSCGCNPAAGLCPSHAAVRDVEAAAVTR
jgi:hypothetical protein